MQGKMMAFEKLFKQLGYCSSKSVKKFISQHHIEIDNKPLKPQFKLRTLVDPTKITLNGEPIPYLDLNMHVLVNKMAGVSCFPVQELVKTSRKRRIAYHEDRSSEGVTSDEGLEEMTMDDDNVEFEYEDDEQVGISVFDIFPETFLYRRPPFIMASGLPLEIGGLAFYTQDEELVKRFSSVRNPLGRTYEVQLRDDFTGLEQDALRTLRGEIKQSVRRVINAPKFIPVDEENKIAHITLHDYKPDNIAETLLSIRHEPISVKRIAIGHVYLENKYLVKDEQNTVITLAENDWCVADQKLLDALLLDRQIQNERRKLFAVTLREQRREEEAKNPKPVVDEYKLIRQEVDEFVDSMHPYYFESAEEEYAAKRMDNEDALQLDKKLEKLDPDAREVMLERMAQEEADEIDKLKKKYDKHNAAPVAEKKKTFKPVSSAQDLAKVFKDEFDPEKLSKL